MAKLIIKIAVYFFVAPPATMLCRRAFSSAAFWGCWSMTLFFSLGSVAKSNSSGSALLAAANR
jgi:hypothetical protein